MNLEQTLIFALAVVAVWRIAVLITTNPRVILEGRVAGKVAIMVISGTLFAGVYLWSSGFGTIQLIGAAMLFICTTLYIPVKSGFTETGMALNGTLMNYEKIQYYTFEEVPEKDEVRIRATCTRKDMTLLFSKEKGQLAVAYFSKNSVPDFATYMASQRDKAKK